jgi:hypothetical protein
MTYELSDLGPPRHVEACEMAHQLADLVLALSGDPVQIANEAHGFRRVAPHVASPGSGDIVELTHEPPGLSSVLPRAIAALERLQVQVVDEVPGFGGVLLHLLSAAHVLAVQVTHGRPVAGLAPARQVMELAHEPAGLGSVPLRVAAPGQVQVVQVPQELPRLRPHTGYLHVSLAMTRYEHVSQLGHVTCSRHGSSFLVDPWQRANL